MAVLLKCHLNPDKFSVKYELNKNLDESFTRNEIEYMETAWINHMSREENKNCFNGNLMQFSAIEFNENGLGFCFKSTDYKHFIATKQKNYLGVCSNILNISNPLTVTGIVETSDNKIVIGTRKNNKNLWQVAGGMFDPDEDIINNKMDFTNCISREVKEELCELSLYDFKFIGVVANRSAIFSTLVFYCKSKENSEYIMENHTEDKVKDFWEMPEIDFLDINENEISKLIRGENGTSFVGTNLASFLLYGRIKFGDMWYYNHSSYIIGDSF
jgi:hypothetical protein